MTRAPLSPELQALRPLLASLVPLLNAEPDWYGSLYLERKLRKTLQANLKNTQSMSDVTFGLVLRIYDGTTLFEQATDNLSPDNLKRSAQELIKRVKTAPKSSAPKRPYSAPSWKERLSVELDSEITSQIPQNPLPTTPVHFGVRFNQDPTLPPDSETLARLRTFIARSQALTAEVGMKPEDLTYIMARQSFVQEESIFIDAQTHMSQTLYRLSLLVMTMSGADRTYEKLGGLGGLEAIAVDDRLIKEMLSNLHALKNAERLKPGKYRVLFGPITTGVLAHEAFGHSQEGDTCARGRSKAWELFKSGTPVGNSNATILNNPAIYHNATEDCGAWGSYFFDEEGWLARAHVLLDRGILQTPMTSLTSAIRLGVPRTANGKRESWASGVYTRQTNTYFSAGTKTLNELMTELGDGFVALYVAGGMEDPKGMGIQVGIAFLQEVRGGKLTGRVFKGPAGGDIQMTGYVPDVLNSIISKSKIEYNTQAPDTARHPFNDAGGCGKYHKEFVNAGTGGPYMLLQEVLLG